LDVGDHLSGAHFRRATADSTSGKVVFRPAASSAIHPAELMPSATALTRANDQAIRRALEIAGVEFIDAEIGGPDVRLRAAPAEN
jgi:hypothetical protein